MGERFIGLIKKPHVLDRNYRLVSESLEKLNLGLSKKARLPPRDKDTPDDLPIADHWHPEAATKTAHARGVLSLIKGIGEDVRDMTNGSGSYRTRRDRLVIKPHWVNPPDSLNAFLSHTVDRNQADQISIDH